MKNSRPRFHEDLKQQTLTCAYIVLLSLSQVGNLPIIYLLF